MGVGDWRERGAGFMDDGAERRIAGLIVADQNFAGRKPRKLAAVALANKMARIIWAMLTRGEDYRLAKPVVA